MYSLQRSEQPLGHFADEFQLNGIVGEKTDTSSFTLVQTGSPEVKLKRGRAYWAILKKKA